MCALKVCYLDFDGVLHDDDVHWNRKRGVYMKSPGRKLFEWMPILEELLAPYPEVKIVLSTTWVQAKCYKFAKEKLSSDLQSRTIGATFHSRFTNKAHFNDTYRGFQVLDDVLRRKPDNWFAIDNDAFNWPTNFRTHLIKTEDRFGLSDVKVQNSIIELLKTF